LEDIGRYCKKMIDGLGWFLAFFFLFMAESWAIFSHRVASGGGASGAAGGVPSAGQAVAADAAAPNPLVVNVSARHCHLTQAAVEALFGKGIS
jgi:hypothetical protein